MKICPKCGTLKELSDFNKCKNRKDNRAFYCRSCGKEYREKNKDRLRAYRKDRADRIRETNRNFRKRHPDRVAAGLKKYFSKLRIKEPEKYAAMKLVDTLRPFGLTPEKYLKMTKIQENRCAVCRCEKNIYGKGDHCRWSVDHDHNCSAGHRKERACPLCVRGLLCHRCNLMLGYAEDRPEVLARAIQYLADPPAKKVLNP